MNPNTFHIYQSLSRRTRRDDLTTQDHLINGALGAAGEAGEIANKAKKMAFHGHDEREKLLEEIGDVLWYLADLCTTLDADLYQVAVDNIAKLKRRYPAGFSEERSINRDDGPASMNEVANEHVIYAQPAEGLRLAENTSEKAQIASAINDALDKAYLGMLDGKIYFGAVNWGDLGCTEVIETHYGLVAYIEEASPDCHLPNYVLGELAKQGIENVTVKTRW